MRLLSGRSSKTLGQLVAGVLEDAVALGVVGFALLGVGGVAYKALSPDGWLAKAIDRLWDKSPGLLWLVAFSIAAVTLAVKHHFDRDPRLTSRGNVLAYAFVALGLFFFFKLLITGSL
jgi:hypothetical protein